jgi:RNA polymerase sigma factor for flagellar operon FliA
MDLPEAVDRSWETYWEGGAPEGEKRHFVIRSFLPLVRSVARALKATLPGSVELADLVSSGVVGLIAAVDRFDPDRGHNFRSYAAIRIRGAMLDELRRLDWAPRSVRKGEGLVEEARKELSGDLGRVPTTEEVAERLGLSAEGYHKLARRLMPRSLVHIEDMGTGPDDGPGGHRFLSDPTSPDPQEESQLRDAMDAVGDAVGKLKDRYRQVISLYYYENLTLKEIARVFGVTESRISQIHSEAVKVLRKRLAAAE